MNRDPNISNGDGVFYRITKGKEGNSDPTEENE
jgi:hypothetical protein